MIKNIFLMAILSFGLISPSMSKPNDFNFIALSDIHFDPFQGCHFAKVCHTVEKLTKAPFNAWNTLLLSNPQQNSTHLLLGMDTNLHLLDKLLVELTKKVREKKPRFIIITGDFIAHEIETNYKAYFGTKKGYEHFIKNLFKYLHAKLQAAAKNTPLYFVMGNNDGYLGDYIGNAGGQFFKDIKEDWPLIVETKEHNSDLLNRSGNYAISSFPSWRLLIINTNLFYKKTQGKLPNFYAEESLNWLSKQLKLAQNNKQKVIMFYHMPYGIQPSKRFLSADIASLWTPHSNEKFFELAMKYKKLIKGMIHGHVHRNAFMVMQKNRTKPLPQQLVSSVSPIFGNTPSFSLFNFKNNQLSIEKIYLKK